MLEAISPIDGRYAAKTREVANYFSEYALITYRVRVEVAYFLKLVELKQITLLESFPSEQTARLRDWATHFDVNQAEKVKAIEAETNHDVKAVEYVIKDQFDHMGLSEFKEMIHFGLTSQDINNTAVPLSFKDCIDHFLYPLLNTLLDDLHMLANRWKDIPMLARTHGQPASPTRLGKEIGVFEERLYHQLEQLSALRISAKFGGATGNFNAHQVAFPEIDWKSFADELISSLGLVRQQTTTQIEHYDDLAAGLQLLKRINTILIDLSRDIWLYISQNYFAQKLKAGEVGSSTMPHKVNPIDFENAEGNLGLANSLLSHLSDKLPVSRLQRDLTDSTVLRNLGVPIAHMTIALQSLRKGLQKLEVRVEVMTADLEGNWPVVAEAYQTILRREGVSNPYEKLKEFTRGKDLLDQAAMHEFVDQLPVSDKIKDELKAITPQNYTGI